MSLKFCVASSWAGILLAMFSVTPALGVELIGNGGFETGDAAGWTITDGGSGTFDVTDQLTPTFSTTFDTVGSSEGSFYAVSSQTGPGTHALAQSFTVPSQALSVSLSFDMFVQTGTAEIIDPIGLDHTGPDNQHARVDVLATGSGAFDTGAGVLQNFYLGIDGDPTQPYTSYAFDITDLVGAGGTYVLRFAQTDNLGFFNQGVDNVSIEFIPIPEPSTLVLAMLAGLVITRRRDR